MARQEIINELQSFIETLKANGFEVYASKANPTFVIFTKENKLGYVECGEWGFNFSTKHKPNKYSGTGYSVAREVDEPTIELALACFDRSPWRVGKLEDKAIEKYSGIEAYMASWLGRKLKKI
ncbi:MAG: hypothetical protein ACE5FF_12845 [Saprospiraceae bacterium]